MVTAGIMILTTTTGYTFFMIKKFLAVPSTLSTIGDLMLNLLIVLFLEYLGAMFILNNLSGHSSVFDF
jgi:hypothetical protein